MADTHRQRMKRRLGITRAQADKAYDLRRRARDPNLRGPRDVRRSYRWRKVRALQLRKRPVCELQLEGCRLEATQVDHRVPLSERPDLAYSMDNLVSVCTSCHARKSQDERRDT